MNDNIAPTRMSLQCIHHYNFTKHVNILRYLVFPFGMYCQMASKILHTMEQRSIQYREHLNPVLNIWYNQCLSHIVGCQIKSTPPELNGNLTSHVDGFNPIEKDSSKGTIVSDKNEATTWRIWNSSVIRKVARGFVAHKHVSPSLMSSDSTGVVPTWLLMAPTSYTWDLSP